MSSSAAAPAAGRPLRVSELSSDQKADLLGLELPRLPSQEEVAKAEEEEKQRLMAQPITFWQALVRRADNRPILHKLFFVTALMIIIPLGAMYVSYYTLFLNVSDGDDRMAYSGLIGALGVNVVTIGFGIYAYYAKDEKEGESEEEEQMLNREQEMEEKRKRWEEWEKKQEEQESLENRARLEDIRRRKQEKESHHSADSVNEEQTTDSVVSQDVDQQEISNTSQDNKQKKKKKSLKDS